MIARPDNKKDFLAMSDDDKWRLLAECYGEIARLGEELYFAEEELGLREDSTEDQ